MYDDNLLSLRYSRLFFSFFLNTPPSLSPPSINPSQTLFLSFALSTVIAINAVQRAAYGVEP